jgi:hypothetical protein
MSPKAREEYRCQIPTMLKCEGYRYRGVRSRECRRPIPRERHCQYGETRDAEERGTEQVGMRIPKESNAETEGYQVMMPITQQQSV